MDASSTHSGYQTLLGRGAVLGTALITVVALASAGISPLSDAAGSPNPPPDIWLAASDQALDQSRGGFNLGEGLVVSFGISRAVYVNDQLVASTSFHLGDLHAISAGQLQVLGQQLAGQALLVQNGPGNSATEPAAIGQPQTWVTTLQNSLNDQALRTQTVVNASTNASGMFKSMNLQNSITEAVANAVGRR